MSSSGRFVFLQDFICHSDQKKIFSRWEMWRGLGDIRKHQEKLSVTWKNLQSKWMAKFAFRKLTKWASKASKEFCLEIR